MLSVALIFLNNSSQLIKNQACVIGPSETKLRFQTFCKYIKIYINAQK